MSRVASTKRGMELIDIGVNLTHKSFRNDLDRTIARAAEAGVAQAVVTGTSEVESRAARALASAYPGVLYATAGVHPHDARHCGAGTQDVLAQLARTCEVVAVGEIGLDFNRDYSPRSDQERAFEMQLELAADSGMPVFMHERDAHARFVAILSRYRARLGAAVIHCFTGNSEELAVYRDLDLHIGITGWVCDERRGLRLRELVRRIPLQRMMLETDAPYLLPRTLKPKPKTRRNEPAYLGAVLATVAECLELPIEQVAVATTRTARCFFALPEPARAPG